jgi:hypothetical protein
VLEVDVAVQDEGLLEGLGAEGADVDGSVKIMYGR